LLSDWHSLRRTIDYHATAVFTGSQRRLGYPALLPSPPSTASHTSPLPHGCLPYTHNGGGCYLSRELSTLGRRCCIPHGLPSWLPTLRFLPTSGEATDGVSSVGVVTNNALLLPRKTKDIGDELGWTAGVTTRRPPCNAHRCTHHSTTTRRARHLNAANANNALIRTCGSTVPPSATRWAERPSLHCWRRRTCARPCLLCQELCG